MRQVWKWLGNMNTGAGLLMATALWLMIGSATMRWQPLPFKALGKTFLPQWFQSNLTEPLLWWWMIPLFLTVTLLGLSTAICTFEGLITLKNSGDGKKSPYRLGVAAFHGCVIIFLLGHLLMEFDSNLFLYTLEPGVPQTVKGTNLLITLVRTEKIRLTPSHLEPERQQHTLDVASIGKTMRISPAELSPVECFGWNFHLKLPEKGYSTRSQAVIEIRKNPGLIWLLGGCMTLMGGIILTGPTLARRIFR